MRIASPHYAVARIPKILLCMVGLFTKWGFGETVLVEPLYFIIELGRMQGPLDSPVMDLSSALASRMIGEFDWEPGPITHDIMHETMFSTNASIEKRPVPNYTGFGSIRGPTEIVVIAKIPSRTRAQPASLSGACLIKSWRSVLLNDLVYPGLSLFLLKTKVSVTK